MVSSSHHSMIAKFPMLPPSGFSHRQGDSQLFFLVASCQEKPHWQKQGIGDGVET